MQTVIENRASTILYNTIVSNNLHKGTMLIPANICPIVPAILHKAKVEFEFFDIDNTDLLPNIDEVVLRLKKNHNINAVLYNHTFGFVDAYEQKFKKIKATNKKVFIINDCCLTRPKTKLTETIADLTLFSTGYSKFVDIGVGGYAFLHDDIKYGRTTNEYIESDHDELVKSFKKSLDLNSKYKYIDNQWLDFRKPKFSKFEYFEKIENVIEKIAKHKSEINSIYSNTIKQKFQLGPNYNDWRFNLSVQNKELILEKIFQEGLFASSHYQSLVGIFGRGNGNNAKQLHAKTLNLFNDFRFNTEKASAISYIVNKYAK